MIELYPTLSAMPDNRCSLPLRLPRYVYIYVYDIYAEFMHDIGRRFSLGLETLGTREPGNGLINSHGAIFAGRDVLATKWNSLNRVSMPHTETRRGRLISLELPSW